MGIQQLSSAHSWRLLLGFILSYALLLGVIQCEPTLSSPLDFRSIYHDENLHVTFNKSNSARDKVLSLLANGVADEKASPTFELTNRKAMRGIESVSHVEIAFSNSNQTLFVSSAGDDGGLRIMLWRYMTNGGSNSIELITTSDISSSEGYRQVRTMKMAHVSDEEKYLIVVPFPVSSEKGPEQTNSKMMKIRVYEDHFGTVVEAPLSYSNSMSYVQLIESHTGISIVCVGKFLVSTLNVNLESMSTQFGQFIYVLEMKTVTNIQLSNYKNFLYLYYREFDYFMRVFCLDLTTAKYSVTQTPVSAIDVKPINLIGTLIDGQYYLVVVLAHVDARGYQAPTTILHYLHSNERLTLVYNASDPDVGYVGASSNREGSFILLADHQKNESEEWWVIRKYDTRTRTFTNSSISQQESISTVVDRSYRTISPLGENGFVTFSPRDESDQGVKAQYWSGYSSISVMSGEALAIQNLPTAPEAVRDFIVLSSSDQLISARYISSYHADDISVGFITDVEISVSNNHIVTQNSRAIELVVIGDTIQLLNTKGGSFYFSVGPILGTSYFSSQLCQINIKCLSKYYLEKVEVVFRLDSPKKSAFYGAIQINPKASLKQYEIIEYPYSNIHNASMRTWSFEASQTQILSSLGFFDDNHNLIGLLTKENNQYFILEYNLQTKTRTEVLSLGDLGAEKRNLIVPTYIQKADIYLLFSFTNEQGEYANNLYKFNRQTKKIQLLDFKLNYLCQNLFMDESTKYFYVTCGSAIAQYDLETGDVSKFQSNGARFSAVSFLGNNTVLGVTSSNSLLDSSELLFFKTPRFPRVNKKDRIAMYLSLSIAAVVVLGLALLVSIGLLIYLRHVLRIKSVEQSQMQQILLENEFELSPANQAKKWMINYEDIKIISKISEGAAGVVYRGMWRSNIPVAIKKMKLQYEENSAEFIAEAQLLISLKNSNILWFLGICVHEGYNFIITELLDRGSLDGYLLGKFTLSMDRKVVILKQICKGMAYLHTHNPPIIHRDLKPQNILLDEDMNVKIGDFGLSTSVDRESKLTGFVGTFQYMAPEVISRNNVQYGPQVDVYSFAMVMYQVLFEVVPFARDHCNMLLLAHEILNGKRPSIPFVDSKADISTCKIDRIPFDENKLETWCSHPLHTVPTRIMKSLTKVMVACWHTDPSLRPTFDGVLLLLGEATDLI